MDPEPRPPFSSPPFFIFPLLPVIPETPTPKTLTAAGRERGGEGVDDGDRSVSESSGGGSGVWRQSNRPLFERARGRELDGRPDDGGVEGGRRGHGWWVDAR